MLKNLVKNYLETEPRFRERKNKTRGLVNLLIKRYPAIEGIPKQILEDVCADFASMDRSWRQTLEHYPHLRGSDYGDKEVLEQEKQVELGYQIGV